MGVNDIPVDMDSLVLQIKLFRKNLREKFLGKSGAATKVKVIDDMQEMAVENGIITALMYLHTKGYITLKKFKQNEPN